MIIRQEKPADKDEIFSVVEAAFLSAEQADGNEQFLVNGLREGENYIPELSLVAEEDGRIIGHILFSKAEVQGRTVLALAPLSVLPEFQRCGVGTALISAGHEIARGLGYEYSVVLGSDLYYPKHGYIPADNFGILPPFDVPRENFMAIRLRDDAAQVHGVLKYAKEFGIE